MAENGDDLNQAISRILPVSATDPKYEKHGTLHYARKKMSISFHDFLSLQVWRACIGELIGTAALVFMIDTIVISGVETNTKTSNIIIASFISLVVTILLLATAPVSGGHLNPIITFSAALEGLISFSRATIYIGAQCLGGVFGALALKSVVDTSISDQFSLGGCTVTGPTAVGIEVGQALALEIICTFIFLIPVGMAFDHRQFKAIGAVVVFTIIGIVVGLLVFVSITVTGKKGYSGAGLNPARCIGPALVRGGHLWSAHWVFWVGPVLGCLAFYFYSLVIPRQHFKPKVNEE